MSAPRSGLVAVLFTDLVGSTELMSQLGDKAFDDLRRNHFAALAKAVAAHGGEEVKNTGDGLMAVFPSAAEAVGAAVAMQQATARHARSGPLAIRVGLAVGDATFEGGDYFGTPVVEAARLVAAARAGQILITQIGRALAASRCTAAFADLGPLALKGLPEPVAVCEVGWQPTGSSVPMPSLLTDVGRIFVGRDTELERLAHLWKEAAAGERRVAFLAGEPGVGKTRLAAAHAIAVHEQGGLVLAGRCDEDLGVPYQPFVEALRHFVDHTPMSDLKERLGRFGGELVRLVPELSERAPDLPSPLQSDPETERYRLFDALAAWVAAASTEDPLVLVLDDLQWAAKPTLLLLRHVLRAPDVRRVLVLGTYRDTELAHDHPLVELLADLRREATVERLPLAGLDDVAVAAIVEQAAGQALDEDGIGLARAIYRETEGNPFFVREVLRHLAETKAIERVADRWATRVPIAQLGIPEGIRDVVGRRLSRLSDAANDALRVGAVLGAQFDADLVQAAGGLVEAELLAALDEAIDARLVSEVSPARFRFSHALVRATLYESLSGARRIALHRHVAEAIEALHQGALDDYLPALAHHWARASAPATHTAKAVDYALRAGDRALAQLANDEAVAYYRQALELLDTAEGSDEQQRTMILTSLGEAQRRAGDRAHRETLLEAAGIAHQRGDAASLARAALANTRGAHASAAGKVDAERLGVLEAALQTVPDTDSAIRARLLATLGLELSWGCDRDRRVRLSDDALGMAQRLGDPDTLARVLLARFVTIWGPDTLAERLANCDDLIAVADQLKDPAIASRAWWLRFRVLTEMGEIEEAASSLQTTEGFMAELGQPGLRWLVTMSRGALELLQGRTDEADRLFGESFEIGKGSEPDAADWYTQQVFEVLLERGRIPERAPQLQEFLWTRTYFAELQAVLTVVYLESDRPDEAQGLLRRFADVGFASVPVNPIWSRAMTLFAEVASRLGDTEAAATLYDLMAPYPDQFPVVTCVVTGSYAHFLGALAAILGRFDNAESHFARAEVLHSRIGSPTWLARTRMEWARMLLARAQPGDADRARELLGQALTTARELGLGGVERQAVGLIGELP